MAAARLVGQPVAVTGHTPADRQHSNRVRAGLGVLLVVLAACDASQEASPVTRDPGTTTTGEPAPAYDGPTLEVAPLWTSIVSPGDLAKLAQVVVVAKPVSGETKLSESHFSGTSRTEWIATDVEVIDVLAGSGVQEGDVLTVVHGVEYQMVTMNAVTEERRLVGDGYAGPLDAEGYVLGLADTSDVTGKDGVWGAVAGTHGRVALQGTDDDTRILEPADGSDGLLQQELAGRTLGSFKEELARYEDLRHARTSQG